jgi:hypothetical protein
MKWSVKPYQAWDVDAEDYPTGKPVQRQLTFLLRYAVLAPSTFNAQPWACRLSGRKLDIYLDHSRMPTRSDSTGRFGHISLGCFIGNLEVAASRFGWIVDVAHQQTRKSGPLQHLASAVFEEGTPNSHESRLFAAIPARTTNRSPRLPKSIPAAAVHEIERHLMEGTIAAWLGEESQGRLVELSRVADEAIWSDRAFRKEHVSWVRTNWTRKYDGMPGFGVGVGNLASLLAVPVILSSKFSRLQTKKNEDAIRHTPNFLVLGGADNPAAWIDVGRSYARIGLDLHADGIALAPMGQFIEHAPTRALLRDLSGIETQPQLFCRVGYPISAVRHSPRRPVEQIII